MNTVSFKTDWFCKHIGLVFLILTGILFHILAYREVTHFYENQLPHYDSGGSYTFMNTVIQHYRINGFADALVHAKKYHLAWLQSFFALGFAPFLDTTPQSLQLYNSLCFFLLLLSIFIAAKSYGACEIKAYSISLIAFLPDVFYDWSGGIMDLQRDPAFVCLLGATFFLFFAYLAKPTIKKSMLVGMMAAFTVLSRGNSIFLLLAIMGPLIVLWATIIIIKQRDIKSFIRFVIPSLILFGIFAGPNLYSTLLKTVNRYNNPYVAYGIGDSIIQSISAHWTKPFLIIFGQMGTFAGNRRGTFYLLAGFIVLLVFILTILSWRGLIEIRYKNWIIYLNRLMLTGGIWSLVITIFLMCFMIKLRPLSFGPTKFPFYPTMITFFSILFIIGMSFRNLKLPKKISWVLAGLWCISIALLGVYRLKYHTPEGNPENIELAKKITDIFYNPVNPPTIAFLWKEVITIEVVKFYASQKHYILPNKFIYSIHDGQAWLDFEVTLPSDESIPIPEILKTIFNQIKSNADFIVVAKDPKLYSTNDLMFIYQYGQPLIERILAEKDFSPVFEYCIRDKSFIILKNMKNKDG